MKKGKPVKGPVVLEFGSYYLSNELGNYEALQIKRGKLVITDKLSKSRPVSIEESLQWAAKRMKQNGELVDEDMSYHSDDLSKWLLTIARALQAGGVK